MNEKEKKERREGKRKDKKWLAQFDHSIWKLSKIYHYAENIVTKAHLF